DGKTDLMAIWNDGTLHLYTGTGTGNVNAPSGALYGGTSWTAIKGLTSGDFNGDGKTDLMAIWNDGTLHLYTGTGTGNVNAPSGALFGGTTWSTMASIAAGDVDGDGRTDLVGGWSDGTLHEYSGNGDGTIDAGVTAAPDSSWRSAAQSVSADLNGDGKSDLIAIDSGNRAWFYPGLGNGRFGAGKQLYGGTSWKDVKGLAAGDFNGDGKADVMAIWSDGSLHLYSGNGDGTINAAGGALYGSTTWGTVQGLAAGDFNGDGKSDLMAIWSDGTLHLYTGNGDGTINAAGGALYGGTSWTGIKALTSGDFNSDGKTDLSAIWNDGTLHLYTGTGTGNVNAPSGALFGGTTWSTMASIAAGDFNQDGKTDLVGDWSDGSLHLYTGKGDGTINSGSLISEGGW
ncbi:VCBS repeat-containing protein, partial [Streptomyces sp. NPDC047017]|uniref:FG-GAP repeat domain-containing protein n=1 Tax=Streptomyces sp. NPDC047017 TaxID=3155024 RepID=UPI003404AB59